MQSVQAKLKLNRAVTQAAIETLAMTTGQDLSVLPVQAHEQQCTEEGIAIAVNLVGDIRGRILLRFTEDAAKQIASALMMGMPIETLDDMSMSALSELGNMVSGGTATHLSESGVAADITTPSVIRGAILLETQTVTIPLQGDNLQLTIDVSIDKS